MHNLLNLLIIGKLIFAVNIVFHQRLELLHRRMSSSTSHGLAPSSQCNFKTHVLMYVEFCTYYGLELFPADVLQKCRYLQYLSEFHKNVDSSKSYVRGMRSLHEIFGFEPPPSDNYMYQLTVSDIRRIKNHVVKQAQPITPEILADMAEHVDLFNEEQLVAWATILTGFHMFLRKSNLVPDSVVCFNPRKQLVRQNLVRMKDCYIAWVYWSKTIQFHEKCLDIPMLPNVDWRLCPVFWLDLYLANVPALPTEPAYSINKAGVDESLTYAQLTYWMREWVQALGLDKTLFSSHSICRGHPMGLPKWDPPPCHQAVGRLEVTGL